MSALAPQTIISLLAILSFLLLGVNALLSPLRKNQDRMESRMDHLGSRMDRLEQDVSSLKSDIAEIKQAVLKKA